MKSLPRHPLRFALAFAASLVFVAGCATSPAPVASRPKLIVFLAVDGLPQRQVVDYRDQLAPDGLRRFLDRGTWFSQANHGYAFTVTAAGHATMLTGAYPDATGIIGNDWRDPVTGEMEYCTGDTSATYIDNATKPLDGTSPKNLRVETLGDVLKKLDPRSKVIAISGKDRGAILPAGKTGIAYMYQSSTGQFASSTFYMKDHPRWVKDFHGKKPADAYFHREWKLLLPESAYGKSLPDGQQWYMKGGSLPKVMGEGMEKPGPAFYGSLLPSPFSDELTLDFARAAIAGEGLGQDDAPDILSVSLSGHDYVNHAYSAESRLSHDHLLRLDQAFQAFFRDLDATVGKDNYVAVLTADHGFMPAPEHSLALGRDAGKQSATQMLARLNVELSKKYGEGQWTRYMSASAVVLNKPLIAEKKLDMAAVSEDARGILLAEKGIAVVYTRAELQSGSRAGAPFFEAMRSSWNAERSGDLQVALKPYWMFSSSSSATTHGSPHPYDTNIPLLFYGPRWVGAAQVDTPVASADIAPTLARVLGVPAPSASRGKVLSLGAAGS